MVYGTLFDTYKQLFAAFAAAGVGFVTGLSIGWANSPILHLNHDELRRLNIDPEEASGKPLFLVNAGLALKPAELILIELSLNLGAMLTSIPSGFFIDAVGRRTTLWLLFATFVLGWLMIFASTDVILLSLGRGVLGAASATASVVGPVYLSEISKAKWRSIISGLFKIEVTMGILFVCVMGTYMTPLNLSLLCLAVNFIIFIPMFWIPETPLFLLWSNQRTEAELSLRWLRGDAYDKLEAIHEELEVLRSTLIRMRAFDLAPVGFWNNLRNIGGLKLFFISLTLMCLVQLSAADLIMTTSTAIFDNTVHGLDPRFSTMVAASAYFVATLAITIIVDRCGRRLLLLISSALITLCLAFLGGFFYCERKQIMLPISMDWMPLTFVSIIMVGYALGLGTVPWIMMGELFPPNLSSTATAIGRTVFWFVGCFVKTVGIAAKRSLGIDIAFWIFCGIQVLGWFFIFIFVPETRGKTSFEILESLKQNKLKRNSSFDEV